MGLSKFYGNFRYIISADRKVSGLCGGSRRNTAFPRTGHPSVPEKAGFLCRPSSLSCTARKFFDLLNMRDSDRGGRDKVKPVLWAYIRM
ncbi:Uncharacterized protein dnm_047660 [Desulfonema magnum]|uniref:Uncharacterized protein n=1 Tax=Desulfonema magnum TaxID=45655 RepID=A0A975BPD2_9BACT|nr:Uncharacterized protein dnm_047660 [Desulfonema magnum]